MEKTGMDFDANFVITFQPNEAYSDFLAWFNSHYSHFEWEGIELASISNNSVRILKNPLYIDESEEDDLQYLVEVMYTKVVDLSVMKEQAKLAFRFIEAFKDKGYLVNFDAPNVESFM